MDSPKKISPGEDLREALSAENINAIIDNLAALGGASGTGSAKLMKLSLARREQRRALDWVAITIKAPAANDVVPIGLSIPDAKRIVGFFGVVGGAVVSLMGDAFVDGDDEPADVPASYQNRTGTFKAWLGPAAGTALAQQDVETLTPSTETLYLKVISVPGTVEPIHVQIIFSR